MARIKASRNGTKKDAIISKAAALFRKKGFSATSMRELAETVGVEAPSLYNHIGSKGEILQVICFSVANEFNNHMVEVAASTGSSLNKLEKLIRFHINMIMERYDEVFVANHEWKQMEEPFLSNFLTQRKSYENTMITIISSGIKQKELRKVHPYVAVLTILSAVRGLESWQRHKKNVTPLQLEKDMVDHLLNGLKT